MTENERIIVPCGCAGSCGQLVLEKWAADEPGSDEWFGDFYTSLFAGVQRRKARERVKLIWALLRGKEYVLHGIVLHHPEAERLRDFLVATTAPMGSTLTRGGPSPKFSPDEAPKNSNPGAS